MAKPPAGLFFARIPIDAVLFRVWRAAFGGRVTDRNQLGGFFNGAGTMRNANDRDVRRLDPGRIRLKPSPPPC